MGWAINWTAGNMLRPPSSHAKAAYARLYIVQVSHPSTLPSTQSTTVLPHVLRVNVRICLFVCIRVYRVNARALVCVCVLFSVFWINSFICMWGGGNSKGKYYIMGGIISISHTHTHNTDNDGDDTTCLPAREPVYTRIYRRKQRVARHIKVNNTYHRQWLKKLLRIIKWKWFIKKTTFPRSNVLSKRFAKVLVFRFIFLPPKEHKFDCVPPESRFIFQNHIQHTRGTDYTLVFAIHLMTIIICAHFSTWSHHIILINRILSTISLLTTLYRLIFYRRRLSFIYIILYSIFFIAFRKYLKLNKLGKPQFSSILHS